MCLLGALLLIAGCSAGSGEDSEESSGQGQAPDSSESSGPGSGTDAGEDAADDAGGQGQAPENPVSEASTNPESIHVLVNKATPLDPQDHEPADLETVEVTQDNGGQTMRQDAASALEDLFAAAEDDGLDLSLVSAYRAFDYQETVYDGYVEESGQEAADTFSARPGYSEHQTGLAADISFPGNADCLLRECFGETEEGQWLAGNAAEHGFIIRYPEGDAEVTGFDYEPWHLRYLGEETAEAVDASGLTLEEYWGRPAAPDYVDNS